MNTINVKNNNAEISENVAARVINKSIKIKEVENLLVANATRKTISEKKWDDFTLNARGLWLYQDYSVAGRGYKKFFNINETQEYNFENILKRVKYPVKAFYKLNGFFCLVFYDHDAKKLRVATKKMLESEYVEYAKEVLFGDPKRKELMEQICKQKNATLCFEIIHDKDPHIIREGVQNEAVLLDVVFNKIVFEKVNDNQRCLIAAELFCPTKNYHHEFRNEEELRNYILEQDANPKFEECEGFVYCDDDGFQFKQKSPYYLIKRSIRSAFESPVNKQSYIHICTSNHKVEKKINDVAKVLYDNYVNKLDQWSNITPEEVSEIYKSIS